MAKLFRTSKPNAIGVFTSTGIQWFPHAEGATERSSDQAALASFRSAARQAEQFEEQYIQTLNEKAGRELTATEINKLTSPISADGKTTLTSGLSDRQKAERKERDERKRRAVDQMVADAKKQAEEAKVKAMTREERLAHFASEYAGDLAARDEREATIEARVTDPAVLRILAQVETMQARDPDNETLASLKAAALNVDMPLEAVETLLKEQSAASVERYKQQVAETYEQRIKIDHDLDAIPKPTFIVGGETDKERVANLATELEGAGFSADAQRAAHVAAHGTENERAALLAEFAGEPIADVV